MTSRDLVFQRIVIVGVGLIGGSVAAAIRRYLPETMIVGTGRDLGKLKPAVSMGLLDGVSPLSEAAPSAEAILFCTPVDKIIEGVRKASRYCLPGTLISDAGSVKGTICRELEDLSVGGTFVGGHPIAGSEKQGFEYANADLFRGRTCVLTPTEETPEKSLAAWEEFWSRLGSRIVRMSPEAHDRALAETSHLPHLISSILAGCLQPENIPLTGTGYADTTRIAGGDPDLWTAICLENAERLIELCDRFQGKLQSFRDALEESDRKQIQKLLADGKAIRDETEAFRRKQTESQTGSSDQS